MNPRLMIASQVLKAQKAARERLTEGLPRLSQTKGQRKLQLQHGTPFEFANACVDSIGTISQTEARNAIDKYLAEWKAA